MCDALAHFLVEGLRRGKKSAALAELPRERKSVAALSASAATTN
jgi:hypothetical protein